MTTGKPFDVDIVTHCWAGKYPHFAQALRYQLSALILHPPKRCRARVVVCCEAYDKLTAKVVAEFMPLLSIKLVILGSAHELGRRSIGRNFAAKGSDAAIVWFTDCDYCIQAPCLDQLLDVVQPTGQLFNNDTVMFYPDWIKIHKDHATGDGVLTHKLNGSKVVDLNSADFVDHRFTRAIGGIQIVRGDFARQYGYLDGDPKWQQPAKTPFGDFHDDIAYRKFCAAHGKISAIQLDGIFRIRHSQTTYK
jgi:hypothetical protein